MKKIFTKEWWIAAKTRAIRTVAQTLGGTIPAGFVVTPAMIHNADWSYFDIILAWLATGFIAGFISLLMSIGGLPEVKSGEE